jgi:hypothetical protein
LTSSADLDALDDDGSDGVCGVGAEPVHDAIQTTMRALCDHDDILVKHVIVSEWIGEDGSAYLFLQAGIDTKSWHMRGMLSEAIAMVEQGDTFDTVMQAITHDEDDDSDG